MVMMIGGITNAGWSTLDLQWMSYLESSRLESGATTMMNTAIVTRLELSSHHDDETNNKNKNHFVLDNETHDNPLFFYKHNNLLHNFCHEISSSFHNDFSAWGQSPPRATTATTAMVLLVNCLIHGEQKPPSSCTLQIQ